MRAAAGGAIMLWPGTSLEFANTDRGTVFRYPLERGQTFSVTYVHSIYRQPVVEEFSVGPGGELVLTGVRSESGAVLEYFGFTDSRPFHAMNRPRRTIVFRVAAQKPLPHALRFKFNSDPGRGVRGERITVRLADVS